MGYQALEAGTATTPTPTPTPGNWKSYKECYDFHAGIIYEENPTGPVGGATWLSDRELRVMTPTRFTWVDRVCALGVLIETTTANAMCSIPSSIFIASTLGSSIKE